MQVNATSPVMKYNIARWNVTSLPYFLVFNRGSLQREFSCNLTTVHKLRAALVSARTQPAGSDQDVQVEASSGHMSLA